MLSRTEHKEVTARASNLRPMIILLTSEFTRLLFPSCRCSPGAHANSSISYVKHSSNFCNLATLYVRQLSRTLLILKRKSLPVFLMLLRTAIRNLKGKEALATSEDIHSNNNW